MLSLYQWLRSADKIIGPELMKRDNISTNDYENSTSLDGTSRNLS